MTIEEQEIQKYIFDPKNPKQCKSYKLLLNIAKKDPLVYVSADFIALDYEKEIVGNDFNGELWDIPDNYEELSTLEKIDYFKELLSEKDYKNYIDTLDFDETTFLYSKIFENLIDFGENPIICVNKIYDQKMLKRKLKSIIMNYDFRSVPNISGSKIIFDNDKFIYLQKSDNFFDLASIIITELKNKSIFNKYYIHKNLKPLYLNKIGDIKILLNVLREDLKKELSKNIEVENVEYLNSISIKNFFSIKDIELKGLNDKKEIYIVGENGDGKSLLLQAIALGLKGVDDGDVFELVKSQKEYEITIEDTQKNLFNTKEERYKNFFAYGASRSSHCQLKEDEEGYLTLFNATLDLKNPIKWLQYIDHSEKSEQKNIISVIKAKELINTLLEKNVEIDINPDKVTFTERGSSVTFEQLSAGYRSVIIIMVDLLARLSKNQPYIDEVSEFRGVVVIDEVELHLHPKWKYDFVKKLRDIFPNIQFIMTTYSPTVILGASKEAVFYKIYKEDGEVHISNQIKNEGYTNNTLLSSPLFDLETVTSRDFEKNVSSDDYVYAKIHERISEKISLESLEDKEKIAKLIDEELAKL